MELNDKITKLINRIIQLETSMILRLKDYEDKRQEASKAKEAETIAFNLNTSTQKELSSAYDELKNNIINDARINISKPKETK